MLPSWTIPAPHTFLRAQDSEGHTATLRLLGVLADPEGVHGQPAGVGLGGMTPSLRVSARVGSCLSSGMHPQKMVQSLGDGMVPFAVP